MSVTEYNLEQTLKHYFGFNNFKSQQREIVESLLDNNDTFVIMPTGGGKSLCYQLPALIKDGTAIVISPLIALMKNQVDSIRSVSNDDSIAHFLNSSLNKTETTTVKNDIIQGKTKVLYMAPESLAKEENIEFLKTINVSFFAVDEAHCISEWGHDFRPEYRKLRPIMNAISNVPVIALTATATPKVQQDIQKNLEMKDAKVFVSSFNRTNLYYEIKPKKNADKEIIKYIKQHSGESGIIYTLSRKNVEQLSELLQVNGIKAIPYHAGLDNATRAKHQDMFLMEDVDVVVATIAFGMGIDKPDVRFVIHYDIPKSIEGYYQETGRAGRDGGKGDCIVFYSYKDIEKLEKFLHGKPIAEQEIGKLLLFDTTSYAETSVCRRKFILHYFGEEFHEDSCNQMCDNCRHPKKAYEGKNQVLLLLNTIQKLKENHKSKHIANVLGGKESGEVKTYKHNTLEEFGKGSELSPEQWAGIIRQCMVSGLLDKEIESYGTIKLTDKGKSFINNPESFKLFEQSDFKENDDFEGIVTQKAGGNATDEVLFKQLKALRKKISDQKGVPPFVIFQDPSLEDMCTQYPISQEELTNISGVGQGKAIKYGLPFIELIKKYVEENEIDRPSDFIVKSIANKSGLKVHVITNLDRKRPIEDIASAKGLSRDDILEEIESIVASGTKVNLGYYINDILDEDSQQEIFDYFMEAETDSISDAYQEFDGDYEEEEIRLMRIKFMSEVAN